MSMRCVLETEMGEVALPRSNVDGIRDVTCGMQYTNYRLHDARSYRCPTVLLDQTTDYGLENHA